MVVPGFSSVNSLRVIFFWKTFFGSPGNRLFVILPHVASMKQKGSQEVEVDQTFATSWLVNQTPPKHTPPRLNHWFPLRPY